MDAIERMTKQGVRDLNGYGPKRRKVASEAPVETKEAEKEAEPPSSSEAAKTQDDVADSK